MKKKILLATIAFAFLTINTNAQIWDKVKKNAPKSLTPKSGALS